MGENDNIPQMTPSFENICRKDENGNEYWSSRDLCGAMGYSAYWKFQRVIDKAIKVAGEKGMNVDEHFNQAVDITELSKRSTGKTIYILDEPTTGLHFADVHKLIEILRRLSDGGNTVVVIEHNLDVIKTADYIIDMGPEGGDGGGTVIAQGTPEEVAQIPESYTGQYVKKYLEK